MRTRTCFKARPSSLSRRISAPVTGVWLNAHTGNGLNVTRCTDHSFPNRANSAGTSQSLRAKALTKPERPSKALGAERDPARASSVATSPLRAATPTW